MDKYVMADRILEELQKAKGDVALYTQGFSESVNLPTEQIMQILHWMDSVEVYPKPFTFFSHQYILTKNEHLDFFLKNGGYSKIGSELQQERISQKNSKELEIEHLNASLALIKNQLKDYKRTQILSWLAILISLASLLWSIFS